MVDVVDKLEGFKLHEGDFSKPKLTQEPDWLVVNATVAGQPRVVPEQPYMAYSKAMNITSVNDHFEVDARRVHAVALLEGQAVGNLSNGKKGRRHRKKKKKKEEKKFSPCSTSFLQEKQRAHHLLYVWIASLTVFQLLSYHIISQSNIPSSLSFKKNSSLNPPSINFKVVIYTCDIHSFGICHIVLLRNHPGLPYLCSILRNII
jgi:hypothetical protein